MSQRRKPEPVTLDTDTQNYTNLVAKPDPTVTGNVMFQYGAVGGPTGFGAVDTNSPIVSSYGSDSPTYSSVTPGTWSRQFSLTEYGLWASIGLSVSVVSPTAQVTPGMYVNVQTDQTIPRMSPPLFTYRDNTNRYQITGSLPFTASFSAPAGTSADGSINTEGYSVGTANYPRRRYGFVDTTGGDTPSIYGNYYLDSPTFTLKVTGIDASVNSASASMFAEVYRFNWTDRRKRPLD